MNKFLLGSAAIAGLVLASAPAQAQMELTIGGHSKNYVGYVDGDTGNTREFDMVRETELHFNGESTLDNGLTFGFQVETEVDGGDDANTIEESYIYMSGAFGRLNLGSEDGASYLLQVAAPSADANIDGIRQYIQPINYAGAVGGFAATAASTSAFRTVPGKNDIDGFDYDHDFTGAAEKITYLSPNFAGFQFGGSYTHDVNDTGSVAPQLFGFNAKNNGGYGQAYEAAARYEGVFNGLGFAAGAGYIRGEEDGAAGSGLDDYDSYNVGLDVDAGPFGIGAAYVSEDFVEDVDTYVVGADYTTGPFKFGASYYNQDDENVVGDSETDRYTGGVIYTAGPGLTFRGSVSYLENDLAGADTDATSVLGGVQINF